MRTALWVVIQGKELHLEAETTEEVLIQLAKALPDGWSIRTCLSCRYGHFCPTGDCDNELFCVTEFEPKEVRDLWHVTEDDAERTKRSRTLFHVCDRYQLQTADYFTYSSYASQING